MFVHPWLLVGVDPSIKSPASNSFCGEEIERIRHISQAFARTSGGNCREPLSAAPRRTLPNGCVSAAAWNGDDFYQALDATCLRGSAALVPLTTGINRVFLPPTDHATAASQLRETFSWRSDKVVRRQARQNWEETLDREVLSPLRRDALAEQDPIRANVRMALAEQARLVHQGQAVLGDKLSAAIDQSVEGGTATSIPIADIESLTKLSDRFLKLVNQVGQWPKPRNTKATPVRPNLEAE